MVYYTPAGLGLPVLFLAVHFLNADSSPRKQWFSCTGCLDRSISRAWFARFIAHLCEIGKYS